MKKSKRSSLAYRDAYFAGRLGIQGKLQIYLAVLISFVISLIWICQIALLYQFYQSFRNSQVRTAASVVWPRIWV